MSTEVNLRPRSGSPAPLYKPASAVTSKGILWGAPTLSTLNSKISPKIFARGWMYHNKQCNADHPLPDLCAMTRPMKQLLVHARVLCDNCHRDHGLHIANSSV
jgi:hypothetical protein